MLGDTPPIPPKRVGRRKRSTGTTVPSPLGSKYGTRTVKRSGRITDRAPSGRVISRTPPPSRTAPRSANAFAVPKLLRRLANAPSAKERRNSMFGQITPLRDERGNYIRDESGKVVKVN